MREQPDEWRNARAALARTTLLCRPPALGPWKVAARELAAALSIGDRDAVWLLSRELLPALEPLPIDVAARLHGVPRGTGLVFRHGELDMAVTAARDVLPFRVTPEPAGEATKTPIAARVIR
jgi:hypothetical protein